MGKSKKAQVWVETVIYTLIGLAIIGILIAVSTPKINEIKDKIAIEDTIKTMNLIDAKIVEVQRASGNRRVLDLKVTKGRFVIDAGEGDEGNCISWVMSSNYQYSEAGETIVLGNLDVETVKASPWDITLSLDYAVNIQYDGVDLVKEVGEASTTYSFIIQNNGKGEDGRTMIDLRVE